MRITFKKLILLSNGPRSRPLLVYTARPLIRHASTKHKQVSVLTIAQPWIKLNCSLGEGPFWEEDTNCLRFLDVEKQRVHRVDLNKGPESHHIVKEFDISIGYVVPTLISTSIVSLSKSPQIFLKSNNLKLHRRHRIRPLILRLRRQIRLRHRQQDHGRLPLDQARLDTLRDLRI